MSRSRLLESHFLQYLTHHYHHPHRLSRAASYTSKKLYCMIHVLKKQCSLLVRAQHSRYSTLELVDIVSRYYRNVPVNVRGMLWCGVRSSKFSEESDEKQPAAVRGRDRAIERGATPRRYAPSRAQTPRDQASQHHPGRTHPYKYKWQNQKKKKKTRKGNENSVMKKDGRRRR